MARQGLLEWSNVGLGLTKWGLIIFNVASWCLGVVSLAIGLWLYITKNEYATLTDGKYLLGSVFLIAIGFGVIIVGFLGIVAAMWESVVIATFYGLMILMAFGMYMTPGIWSFVNLNHVSTVTSTDLSRTMAMYERNQAYSASWDSLQSNLMCCGLDSYTDWSSNILRPRLYPRSCCRETTNCQPNQPPLPTSLHSEGCVDRLTNYHEQQLNVMGPIGLSFGLFQIFGILICTLFCIAIRKTKSSYYT